MAVFEGCEGNSKTWDLEERKCPKCGEEMDVYTYKGRVVEDSICGKCGYVLKAQEQVVPGLKKRKKNKTGGCGFSAAFPFTFC